MGAREFASRDYRTASSTPRGAEPEDVAHLDPYVELRGASAPTVTRSFPDYSRGPPYASGSRFEDNLRSQWEEPHGRNMGTAPSNPSQAYGLMRKWNIRFSGSRQEDVDNFLKRIEEGRDLVPISDSDLLRVLPFFLTGLALNWFRGSRHRWRTFVEFARACRLRFGDQDFQFELRQEIHRRTQGEKESVADYLTCMQALFTRVVPRLSEVEEVSYAHRNLLPRIHLAIRRSDVLDFQHLEVLASSVEKSHRVARGYRPPPTPERSLLPDLAYHEPRGRAADKQRDRLAFMEEEEEFFPHRRVADEVYVMEESRNNTQASRHRPPASRTSPAVTPGLHRDVPPTLLSQTVPQEQVGPHPLVGTAIR